MYASRANPSVPLWRKLLPMAIVLPVICLMLTGLLTWLLNPNADDFWQRWARSFAISLPIMQFGLMLMTLLSRRLAPALNRRSVVTAKLVLALITACVMEALMATIVVFTTSTAGHPLLDTWVTAFVKSFPAGLVIALTMAFILKPRMERWAKQGG